MANSNWLRVLCRGVFGNPHASPVFRSTRKSGKALGKRPFRPSLEALECRTTPTAFTWTGFMNNVWENAANWSGGGAGQYPGSDATYPFDTARLDNTFNNRTVNLGVPVELASINVSWTKGLLQLNAQLTLNNGGLLSSGTVIQRTGMTNGPINLTGGVFDWTGGDINYAANVTTTASTFTVGAGAVAEFVCNNNLGSNLAVQGGGILYLMNEGFSIHLANSPTITNAGAIMIQAHDSFGISRPAGDPPVPIQNTGSITANMDRTGSYVFCDPVFNRTGGVITVNTGWLEFQGANPDARSISQSSGSITVMAGATLKGDNGFNVTGGLISASGAGHSYFDGPLTVDGGTMQVTDAGGIFDMWRGNVVFASGTAQFTFDLNSRQCGQLRVNGNITVTRANTTVAVSFVGTGNMPDFFDVMRCTQGTVSDVAGTNPAGYDASIFLWLGDYGAYRLRRQQ